MQIKENTKTVYLAIGNEPQTKEKLKAIDAVTEAEVWVIYSDKISSDTKAYIDGIAKKYSFVALDCVKKSKSRKISGRLIQRIKELHSSYPALNIVLLSSVYRSQEMLEMESQGIFSYGSSLDGGLWAEAEEQTEDRVLEVRTGGKMQILIDYENVGTAGLNGAEYLCEDDTVTLFYSAASSKIERQCIEAMEKQSGGFDIVKLRAVGKNGLDFYIAVRVGQIAESSPDAKVLIITKDNGYQAIRDYCQGYTALKDRVTIKDTIEAGIVAMDGNTERRKTILEKRQRVSIETEYSAYEERSKLEKNIIEACRGTEYENVASKIIEMMDSAVTPRDRYLSSLRMFGRNDGAKIYRLIRETV